MNMNNCTIEECAFCDYSVNHNIMITTIAVSILCQIGSWSYIFYEVYIDAYQKCKKRLSL
jgi:hypothetical protein